ncbi:DUF6356 family protein [Taklimakanibacter deserti]|uniref:DUF6356 family protein n=1 Tax=Taklimakanibacter deserti TaxID=2267839 RepID=UPI003F6855A8
MMQRLFFAHPHKVGEGYFEHMLFALTFSGRLFKAAGAAFLHAFVPALCETTASQAIIDMHAEIAARRKAMAQSGAVSASAATRPYHGQGAASS